MPLVAAPEYSGGGYNNLKPVEIRFPHDDDPETVVRNWNKRCKRVNYEKLALICDDKALTEKDFEQYDRDPAYRKVMLTSKELPYQWAFQMKEYKGQQYTGEYNAKSTDGLWRFTKMWDYVSFLNGES